MSSRNNEVILANGIHNTKDYSHVLNMDMLTLVRNNATYTSNNLSMIRVYDNKVKIDCDYNIAFNSNYIAVKDNAFPTRWVFGWIDSVNYISDNCTEIIYTIDLWSTYRGTFSFNRCYISRQHPQSDGLFSNLENEPIEIDSYVTNAWGKISANPDRARAVFSEERIGENQYQAPDFGSIDSQGLPHTMFEVDFPLNANFLGIFSSLYGNYVKEGHGESLLSLQAYHSTGYDQSLSLPMLQSLDGYTPIMKKCLQYPFSTVLFSNNSGNLELLKPQLFTRNTGGSPIYYFRMLSVSCGEGQTCCVPWGYAGIERENYEHSLSINDYPMIPVPCDAYKTWKGQNKGVLAQQLKVNQQSSLFGFLGENGFSSIPEKYKENQQNPFVDTLGSLLIPTYRKQKAAITAYESQPDNMPDSVIGKVNDKYINWSFENLAYTVKLQTVPYEKAKKIDSMFCRYGYAQNEVQQVNTTNPKFNFHYVETGSGESALRSNVAPANVINTLNQRFENGITIHTTNTTNTTWG